MRIVFMGTPAFAVEPLRRLAEDGYELAGVFTQPDKPKNRGMKLAFSPVKEYALSQGLAVFQPQSMRAPDAIEQLRALRPDLAVVAAYGQILTQEALDVPRLGCVNIHASILPRYRGAAPINWAILNGESETGVTLMHMARRLDAGDMIAVRKTPIAPDEDAEALTARLSVLGAELLSETMPALLDGTAPRTAQDDAQSSYAPMLSRGLSPIDWTKSAREVVDHVRGLIPWPCAQTTLEGKALKVFRAEIAGRTSAPAGTLTARRGGIEAACGDGQSVLITELQAEGGRRMAASAYLNGRRVAPGSVLEGGR